MYEALTEFLITFSSDFPIVWALLVMVVVGATGLALYAFWELALKAMAVVLRRNPR